MRACCVVFVVVAFVISSCAAPPRVRVDHVYRHPIRSVAVLPMHAVDDSTEYEDSWLAERLTTQLMEQGVRVVDANALKAEARERSMDVRALLTSKDFPAVASKYKLDGAFTGETRYQYDGPSAGKIGEDSFFFDLFLGLLSVLFSGGESSTSHTTVAGSYASTGGYRFHAAHLYFLEASHGDTVLSAHADSVSVQAMLDDISEPTKRHR